MHWQRVDIFILVIIGLSIFTGLLRGFVKEILAFVGWSVAIWLAFKHSDWLVPWLQPFIKSENICHILALIVVLIATLVASALLNMGIGFFIKRSGLSGMDRVLGMGFGFLRGVFIISLALVVIKITALPVEGYAQHSFLYAKFDPLVDWLSTKMPGVIEGVKGMDKKHNYLDLSLDLTDVERTDASKKPLRNHIIEASILSV